MALQCHAPALRRQHARRPHIGGGGGHGLQVHAATAARVSSPPASAPCARAAATREAEHAVSTVSEGPAVNRHASVHAVIQHRKLCIAIKFRRTRETHQVMDSCARNLPVRPNVYDRRPAVTDRALAVAWKAPAAPPCALTRPP